MGGEIDLKILFKGLLFELFLDYYVFVIFFDFSVQQFNLFVFLGLFQEVEGMMLIFNELIVCDVGFEFEGVFCCIICKVYFSLEVVGMIVVMSVVLIVEGVSVNVVVVYYYDYIFVFVVDVDKVMVVLVLLVEKVQFIC